MVRLDKCSAAPPNNRIHIDPISAITQRRIVRPIYNYAMGQDRKLAS
jgi:hypothetical protein